MNMGKHSTRTWCGITLRKGVAVCLGQSMFSNIRNLCNVFISGKTLGGGSSINGMTWTRGAKAQYDAMHDLLGLPDDNPEWKFEDLFKYMKKV